MSRVLLLDRGSSEAVLRFDVDSGDELGAQTALSRNPDPRPPPQRRDGSHPACAPPLQGALRFLGPADEGLIATIASISADGGTVRLTA
jgi:hypothetical protein